MKKKVTEQLRHLVTRLIDIKSTLKDGTPNTFFREITEFKGKVSIDVIGACSPLGIIIGGKIEL
jgi:Fe-S cluster biogenesis protein NfuA